ncbi:hypothetical protein [Lactobacillus delbrueckii]|uniref:hypothetical protein n=1 Tax=Lactobacillus delbrueckii TaxID=1584 RepID=UPI001E28FE7E|nr:hypothetical protein [Lactobacillus delbrueckii]
MQLVNRESSAVKDKQLLFPNMLSRNSGKKRIIFKVKAIISQKKSVLLFRFFGKNKTALQNAKQFQIRCQN